MKHAKVILLLFTFLFIFGSMNIAGNNVMAVHEDTRNVEPNENVILSYESHGVISIIGDMDFETQATNEMWLGDGSIDTPYLIQGYSINNDTHLSIEIIDVSLYFEIRDCKITSATPQNAGGVSITNVTHGKIENCVIAYKNTGLGIHDSTGFSIVNCTMNNNAAGATVENSNHTTFSECYFTNTTTGSGFYQDYSHWTSITDSYFNNNGDYGVESYSSNYFTFTGNEATENDYAGLLLQNSHYGEYQLNTVFDNGNDGIILWECHHIIISENTIYDNDDYGLNLNGPEYGQFTHNTIYGHRLDGIYYNFGGHSIIESNTIFDNGWIDLGIGSVGSGINIESSTNNSVIDNHIYNNSAHGVFLNDADYSIIQGNTIWGNLGSSETCGIFAYSADFCTIIGNTVYNNTDNGIFLRFSDDCNISHNIVYENSIYGLALDDSNRTLIYYNDFGWNPTNAYSSVDSTDINYWDNGTVGNWWSDAGTSTYNISGPAGEQDMHPSKSLVLGPASDAQYELGSTGNALLITAQALNPWYYEVLIDTQIIETHEWNGGMITPSIDGLDVGVYDLTVRAFHISGHYLTCSSTVTVADTTPPGWVIVPTDQSIQRNEVFSYQLEATDLSEIDEWIVNDTIHFSITDGLLTNSTLLEVGYYHLNITVVDVHGNARTALITIHVITIEAPTVDMTGLLLIVGGAGAALLAVVVVVVIMKKKSG